ncbi:sulfatase [Arthrobacter sp. PAMC 25486]|uniref:sulfatase-like hydrolase/transferase n=1 Tax=Arthrobacter sp. PAMC 25486 TaxID=1494608 RepID=UPI0005361D82|nr:sulfatase-like hydrolase/transferase [Arthrobacter sp. PAMC 25486]AIY03188.1 sulfatase [Arthrobacter sp. PAMC 25486]
MTLIGKDTRPRLNFLVVLTDDQGRWAVPWRMPELVMPHLDTLLKESLELDEFYCASPVCSPARASLITGRMPSAHGIHDWLVGEASPDAYPDRYLEGQPTTPELLDNAGYECMMSGKWHVGHSQRAAPGFSSWYAHRHGGGPYFNAPIWQGGEPEIEERYLTHAITDNAVTFLQQRDASRPFYLQVNYTAPHDPWIDNHPQEYLDHYADTDFPSVPREERHPWTNPRKRDFAAAFADPAPHIAGYCASLTAVDEGLGLIRAELERQGTWENTVVLFTSDNGFSCGHHGIWGKGNGTFPLNFWDNSVRVPALVKVPGGATGVSGDLISAASWHATVCELAGVEAPHDEWAVSKSFAELLRGGVPHKSAETVTVLAEYGQGRMITDGQWKLVIRAEGPCELYDRQTDPSEQENRYDLPSARGVRNELTGALSDWFAQHERASYSAYTRGVTGFGQIHPLSRGRNDTGTYMQPPQA